MNHNNKMPEENYRDIAWKYFKLHANQRITLFRFYIIFFSLFSVVIGHLISEFHFAPVHQELIVILLSVVFLLITIIFWCIDNRNRYLIHNAEDYFVKYETKFTTDGQDNRFIDQINKAAIFTIEENDKKNGKCNFRHTIFFRIIYFIGIILSIIFISFSVYSIYHHNDNIYYQIKILKTQDNIPEGNFKVQEKNLSNVAN